MNRHRASTERWFVDFVEDGVAVLVLAEGTEEMVVSRVAVHLLEEGTQPGTLLDVPLGELGEPVWARAERVDSVNPPGPRTGPSGPG